MGSLVRQLLCERFIKEFSEDYFAKHSIPGVEKQYLEIDENDEVRHVFEWPKSNERYCRLHPIFGPGLDTSSYTTILAELLERPEAEILNRLVKAEIVDD
jgi:hypothetical protein